MNRNLKTLGVLICVIGLLGGAIWLLPSVESEQALGSDGVSPAVLIEHVRLFDGEQVRENTQVLLHNGYVVGVGELDEWPEALERVDGSGKTLLPGLIDSHVHAYGNARKDALRFGVTTMLDMFRPPDDFSLTHQQRAGFQKTRQADLWSAGYLATATGGHGTQYGLPVPTIETPQEVESWVDQRLAEGSDYIKLVIENGAGWGGDIPTLNAEIAEALVAESRARGRLVMAHVATQEAASMALAAGVDGLVHMFEDQAIDPAWVEQAAQAGLWVVPTTTVLAGIIGQSGTQWIDQNPVMAQRLGPEQRGSLDQTFPGSGYDSSRWPVVINNLKAMMDAGIPILAGSDAPNPATAHGASLHHELYLLVQAGLSPAQALKAATATPAAIFGLTARGCLKVGCRADAVLVEGNPLQDITATGDIRGVWKNGYPLTELMP